MPRARPSFLSCSTLASAWPVCSSLSISSNSRLCGTSASSGLTSTSGRAVLGSSRKPKRRQLGAEAHRADGAHRVFAVARGRIADHAQQLLVRVGDAAVVVHHHARLRVVVHGVDGEVAPRGVLVLRAPDVVAQHPAAGVHRVLHAGQLALGGGSLPLTASAVALST
jgi:hypothetical protein